MKVWRIYRLPGSRQFWLFDSGEGTQRMAVKEIEFNVKVKSVDIGCGHPRAWLEISAENAELHIIDGRAIWSYAEMNLPLPPNAPLSSNMSREGTGRVE